MLSLFVVLAVVRLQLKRLRCGLIADRLFTIQNIAASGKSFTSVSAKPRGGHGAPIALPLILKNPIV